MYRSEKTMNGIKITLISAGSVLLRTILVLFFGIHTDTHVFMMFIY